MPSVCLSAGVMAFVRHELDADEDGEDAEEGELALLASFTHAEDDKVLHHDAEPHGESPGHLRVGVGLGGAETTLGLDVVVADVVSGEHEADVDHHEGGGDDEGPMSEGVASHEGVLGFSVAVAKAVHTDGENWRR